MPAARINKVGFLSDIRLILKGEISQTEFFNKSLGPNHAYLQMAVTLHEVHTDVAGIGPRSWDILRLDRSHPVVSGNKPFKLHFFLSKALGGGFEGILTFGGPYSNHIHAAAFAAASAGLKSIGVIRGERPHIQSPTLADAERNGMSLQFMDRQRYRKTAESIREDGASDLHPGYLVIPEGGTGGTGMEGAALIHGWIPRSRYDAILCACGTGTTMAGLVRGAEKGQRIVGVSVLKNDTGLESRVSSMVGDAGSVGISFIHGFHFGGYAKRDPVLTAFMNRFHERHGVPSEFVYTGKLFFAAEELIRNGFFHPGERILCIHSGGLQGNRSLPEGVLRFE